MSNHHHARDLTPLPLREGIKPSYLHLPQNTDFDGKTLLAFLCTQFPFVGESAWCARLNSGCVVAQDGTRLNEHNLFHAGETVYYYREVSRDEEPRIPFDEVILAIDEHLIVVDKPHFLPVIPSGRFLRETLLTRLRLRPELQHLNVVDITPIHRLDKDTAGVMLFSHNRASRGAYQSLFQSRLVDKTYEAVAAVSPELPFPLDVASRLERDPERFYRTRTAAGEPNAFSRIECVHRGDTTALYRLHPSSGRKHQLRVHMMALGLPIMNDGLYPQPTPMTVVDYEKPLQLLARRIAFTDPFSGQMRAFESQRELAFAP